MRNAPLLCLMLLAVSTIGCGGQKIPAPVLTALEKSESFELYSLNPDRQTEKPENAFYDWEVLGSTKVEKAATRAQLVAALKKGAADNDGIVAGCFNPRHAIRVVHEGKTIDLVICFECYQVTVYIDDKRQEGFLTMDSPQPIFNKVLKDAKVKLPQSSDE